MTVNNPGCGKSPIVADYVPQRLAPAMILGFSRRSSRPRPFSIPIGLFPQPRADFYRPRGMPACASHSLSGRFYDGQGDVWACAWPGGRLTRITFIRSSLCAGF